MQKRNLFVRITAIVLCAIMLLGVVTAAFYAFAAEDAVLFAAPAQTGSPNNTWVIIAVVVALVVVIGCAVVPKLTKKK